MRKGTSGDEAVSRQAIENIWGAKAVAYTAVFGALFAVLLGNCFRPFWDSSSGKGDVLVSPCCMIEAYTID
jgi:hypothetical protein